MKAFRFRHCLLLGMLILACAFDAQAKTSLPPVPNMLSKIIFQRGEDVWMYDAQTKREWLLYRKAFYINAQPAFLRGRAFSPDWKRFVISYRPLSFKERTGSELYLAGFGLKGLKRVTNTNFQRHAMQPRFSPDGKKIVYTRESGDRMGGPGFSGMEIRFVNIDGSNDRRVIGNQTDITQSYEDAFWSRDGKRLLFTHNLGNVDYGHDLVKQEFQTCRLDGSDVQPFNGDYGKYIRPEVSPDGQFRVITDPPGSQTPSYLQLRLSTAKGKFVRQLVHNKDLYKSNLRWSTDSKFIIFDAFQTYTLVGKQGQAREVKSRGIWSVTTNGKDLRCLVTNAFILAIF